VPKVKKDGWMKPRSTLALALVCSAALLSGCERAQSLAATQLTSSTQSSGPPSTVIPPDVVRIPDIPIPPNGKVVREDTAISGPDDKWNGQVVNTTSYSAAQMTEYYRVEMPKLGWNETAVVRARRTAITFTAPAARRRAWAACRRAHRPS
jgi:hypothetical protein